jgi:hypothetical protein
MNELPTNVVAKIKEAMAEAHGLLTLMKPLTGRKGKLTDAETQLLLETLSGTLTVLREAESARWRVWENQRMKTSMVEVAK